MNFSTVGDCVEELQTVQWLANSKGIAPDVLVRSLLRNLIWITCLVSAQIQLGAVVI
jgi:hypothetical protein